jgi:sialate O-acetylesterase
MAAIILAILSSSLYADVKLPAIFGDNMVLQQKSSVAVWGWADAGEKIEVLGSWMKNPATAKADKNGDWHVKIKTPAAGATLTLTIKGNNTITLQDVLAGEVWVCSGQSNMEWPLNAVIEADKEVQEADFPQIRLFTVAKNTSTTPQQDCTGQWKICSPQTVGPFSAVGYLFGREIHQKLNVPVGLINTSWGGTPAEAWTSQKTLKSFENYKPILQQLTQTEPEALSAKRQAANEKAIAQWEEQIDAIDPGTKQNWQDPKTDVSDWKEVELPRPWTGTELEAIDGIVWYHRVTNLPPSWARTDLELHLGAIDDADTVWVNGVKIASTGVYNQERKYFIPRTALHVGPNVIRIRVVDNMLEGGFTGTEDQMRIGPVGADAKTCATVAKTWKYKVSLSGSALPTLPQIDPGMINPNMPTVLYNGMIAPIVPYRIAGAIWYQGEANIGRSAEYAKLFPAMIGDWRKQWNIGDFPFYWVQIAPFNYGPGASSAYLREAQTSTLKSVKNGGMAVTMDTGVKKDIHPKNKQDVGKRLSLWALAKTYGRKNIAYAGPIYKSFSTEGQKIRLQFNYTYGGLSATDGHLNDFVIAGADKNFVPAEAIIDGDTVVVSSPQVQKPVAVRYGWSNWTVGTLFNKAGLPAPSFRTDDWNDNRDK